MRVYSSNSTQERFNTVYPNEHEIDSAESLLEAVKHDYVCALYADNERGKNNFIKTDCLPLDVDNDHSEDPEEWITSDDIPFIFPEVTYAIHFSRNNQREKNGKAARPKFHILFPIDEISDVGEYEALKKQVAEYFSRCDHNALDGARFFYGTHDPDVIFVKGSMNLSDFMRGII